MAPKRAPKEPVDVLARKGYYDEMTNTFEEIHEKREIIEKEIRSLLEERDELVKAIAELQSQLDEVNLSNKASVKAHRKTDRVLRQLEAGGAVARAALRKLLLSRMTLEERVAKVREDFRLSCSWPSSPVGRYVADVIERIAVRMWPDAKPKKKPADSSGQSQEAEAEDEIAAIIAASRAAVDRPAAASTSAMNWDDREMEAAAPSAGRHAVDFGPVGTPPPDDAKPGWLRDTSIQCGISCVLSEFQTPRQTSTPVFGPARPPRDKDNITPEVRNTEIQTQVSNPSGPHQGHLLMEPGSDFRRSISGPLETVDEGEREETPPTPPTEKAEAKAQLGQATQKPPGAGHSSETEASKPIQPRASSEKRHKLRETRSPQRSLSPVQPLRTLLPHEQEELYSGISQAPSSTLAFGRRLQGRRPTPPGAQAFSWSEDLSCDEPSAIIAPIPAGHLHRICDPFAKRARPVWVVNRSSTPRSSELRRIKPLPKGLESRPPESVEPDIRTEVHAVMAHRRAKDWLMADNLQLRNTATEQDFRKRGVAAGAVYYAKPSTSCLQSLGAGGNFPGGRR